MKIKNNKTLQVIHIVQDLKNVRTLIVFEDFLKAKLFLDYRTLKNKNKIKY